MRVVARSTAIVAALLAPFHAGAADVTNGARIYAIHCIGCHGVQGQSPLPNVPNFTVGAGLMQPDIALLQSIRTGKAVMPGYLGILRDQEILDVIAYIRTLSR